MGPARHETPLSLCPMKAMSAPESSRRGFLLKTGLGLAAVSTLSCAGAQGSTAHGRIRLGLIGCGARGTMLLKRFTDHGGCEVAGVAGYVADHEPAVHTLAPALQQKVQFLNPEYLVYAPGGSSNEKLPPLDFSPRRRAGGRGRSGIL